MNVLQAQLGGSGTGTTSSVGYNTLTRSNSLLQCVVFASINGSAASNIVVNNPNTAGFSWVLQKSYSFTQATLISKPEPHEVYQTGVVSVYAIIGASPMATSVKTSVTATNSGGTTPSLNFNLYEVSGLSSLDASSSATNNSFNSPAVPNAGNLTTTNTDFIFVAVTGDSGVTGTGYTQGVTTGEQYILNQAPGTVGTSFGGSASNDWAVVAVAYSAAPPVKTQAYILGM